NTLSVPGVRRDVNNNNINNNNKNNNNNNQIRQQQPVPISGASVPILPPASRPEPLLPAQLHD
ncbi:unnamed protein product, partial [Polarella glacialis]